MYYTVGTISSGTLTQLQQTACPTTAATIMSRSYNFGQGSNDNGTVQTITNCLDTTRTQNFVYDSLNRIQQAYTSGPNWGETIGSTAAPGVAPSTPGIDAWGNLWQRSGVTGKTYYEPLNCPANTKNQLTTCSTGYDSAGNMTSYGTATYAYDGENRLLTTAGVTYTYDGDGKRVKKSTGMLYWTGTGSDALLETDLSGNPTAEYVLFGGRRLARIDRPANSVEYYYSDHLGSTDVVTNATGVKVKESDYYPYGGEIPIITGDSNRYKFNGKERDSESGLDNFGARYDASNLGRFMAPDWAARPTAVPYAVFGDPQSLNLYGYVRNDPVSRADADGHDTEGNPPSDSQECTECSTRQSAPEAAPKKPEDKKNEINTKPPTPDPAHVHQDEVRSAPSSGKSTANGQSLTIGVGLSGNGEVGVVKAGAGANVSESGLVSSDGKSASLAVQTTGGATAYAGDKVAGAPTQNGTPLIGGAYIGGGLNFAVSNASPSNLAGPFQTITGNVGVVGASASVQLSFDSGGHYVFSVTVGPGVGVSGWAMTTNTMVGCVLGGC